MASHNNALRRQLAGLTTPATLPLTLLLVLTVVSITVRLVWALGQ